MSHILDFGTEERRIYWMENIVVSLATQLNKKNIKWGIGGSYLLKSYGIVEEVHDLDIIVAEDDILIATQILDLIADRKSIPIKEEYKTKHFYVYSYRGLSIDVMSSFRIEHSDGIYEFLLDDLSIVKRRKMEGVYVPFTSLEDWLIAYKLMKGREEKVDMIEDYFNSEGIEHIELFERTLKQELPPDVRIYIKNMLDSSSED